MLTYPNTLDELHDIESRIIERIAYLENAHLSASEISFSVVWTSYPQDGATFEDLIGHDDAKMYKQNYRKKKSTEDLFR